MHCTYNHIPRRRHQHCNKMPDAKLAHDLRLRCARDAAGPVTVPMRLDSASTLVTQAFFQQGQLCGKSGSWGPLSKVTMNGAPLSLRTASISWSSGVGGEEELMVTKIN